MKPKTIAIIGLVGMLLLGAVLATSVRTQEAPDHPEVAPDVVVHVEGMACQLCARSMRKAVGEIEGVSNVEVLLDEQEVHVTLEENTSPSEEEFEDAVTKAGFTFEKAVYADDQSGTT